MRTSSDIDILVQENDLKKAIQEIEENTDFKVIKNGYHDVSLVNANIHLELHFNIKENLETIDELLKDAWKYAEKSNEGFRYTFFPEFQIFYVIAHMRYHFLNGGLGIRPFLDLWLLITKTEYDEATVRQMCSNCGIIVFYEECVHLSKVWMENSIHTEATALLEKICLSVGVFGYHQFKNAGKQRNQRGIKYVLSRVSPTKYQVKEYYKDKSGKEQTVAYYYMKRIMSWTGRERSGELRQQIHDVMVSD